MIVVSEYAVTTPPSWHQRKAGHAYGSIMLLWWTDESPHIWDTVVPELGGNAKPKPWKKKAK